MNEHRRHFLRYAGASMAVVAVAGAAGVELISRGVLPGKGALDELDGACSVDGPELTSYVRPGPQLSGAFYSAARRRAVAYTIGYPPGHGPGDELPLVVMLHGYGDDHATALSGMSPAQAVALRVGGTPLPPMALVTVDGGPGYWNPHPGDNPLGMLTGELIPLCRRRGLGRPPRRIGVMGISMGGYGALLLAERRPDLVAAVAAISPAIWTSYDQARAANPGAYASAADFAADDAVTHAAALARVPVRVAAGHADPFYSGVQALARALPKGAAVDFINGCHDSSFFTAQEPPSLAFLARHIALPAEEQPFRRSVAAMAGRGIAVGVVARTGRAVVVMLRGSRDVPGFVARREIELAGPGLPAQPFHAAAGLDPAAARMLISRTERGAAETAAAELRAVVASLPALPSVSGVAVVVKAVAIPDSVEEILRSHAWMHAAEGLLYRGAVLAAAQQCGWTAYAVDLFTLPAADQILATLGRDAGRPWRRTEKDAARAALTLLR